MVIPIQNQFNVNRVLSNVSKNDVQYHRDLGELRSPTGIAYAKLRAQGKRPSDRLRVGRFTKFTQWLFRAKPREVQSGWAANLRFVGIAGTIMCTGVAGTILVQEIYGRERKADKEARLRHYMTMPL